MRVQATALVVVVLAGIYLASDLHQWKHFYVGWGLAASIVIGGIGGAFISPREKRMIELTERELGEREVAAAPSGPAQLTWSDEYGQVARQAELARLLQLALVVITIVLMSVQA